MGTNLRKQLEEAYEAYHEALKTRDLKAFARAVAMPPEFMDDDFAAEFEEFAEFMTSESPEPGDMQFLAIKTIGDDLAGYYCMWKPEEEPGSICVALTRFAKTGEGWKVQPGGGTSSFEPPAGQDVKALAMERVESDPVLELTARGEDAGAPPFDRDVSAVLECFAYDCQLDMAVNGVKLAYGGGSSYGLRLFGAAEGAPPAEPGLLKVGPNRIDVKYRRTAEGSPLTVELYIQPAGRCLRMVGGKPAGEMSATFTIARKPTEQLTADEIECVEVVDE